MSRPGRRAVFDRWAAVAFPWIVFAVALAVRVYFVARADVTPADHGDAGQYLAYAWNLVRHGTFSVAVGDMPIVPDAWRAPGYPAFLAAFLAVWGENAYMPILLAQATVGAATVALGSALARRTVGLGLAMPVAILGTVWPHLVAGCAYLLAETLYGGLVMATAWALAGATGRSLRWPVIAGIGAALAWLVNPVCAAIWVVLAGLLALRGARRAALVFLLVFALAPVGWSLRNAAHVPDGAVGASSRAWVNFVQGSRPEYHLVHRLRLAHVSTPPADAAWREMEEEIAVGERSRVEGLRRVGARLARTPLESFAWYVLYKPADLWGWDIAIGQGTFYVFPTYRSPYEQVAAFRAIAAVCLGLNPLVAFGAFAGVLVVLFRLVRPRRRPSLDAASVTVAVTLLVATLVHILLQAEARYAVPYRMFEFIGAALAVRMLIDVVKSRRPPREGVTP